SAIGRKNSTLNLVCKRRRPSPFDIRGPTPPSRTPNASHQRIFAFRWPFKDPIGYPSVVFLARRSQCFVSNDTKIYKIGKMGLQSHTSFNEFDRILPSPRPEIHIQLASHELPETSTNVQHPECITTRPDMV
uniref:Uncharacterized protein n=1 Tax=Cucumis melo TaxID=3656 RepID=A0A9I9EMQ0_CUCME